MTIAKKIGALTGLVCVLLIGILIYSILAKRSFHNAAIIRDSGILLGFIEHWQKAGEPQGDALEKLLSSYGSLKPFVYTNSVNVGGTNFVCLFAIQDVRFAEVGKLVVARAGTIIWIGEKDSRIVLFNR